MIGAGKGATPPSLVTTRGLVMQETVEVETSGELISLPRRKQRKGSGPRNMALGGGITSSLFSFLLSRLSIFLSSHFFLSPSPVRVVAVARNGHRMKKTRLTADVGNQQAFVITRFFKTRTGSL